MEPLDLLVVPTGIANLASVRFGLLRAGATVRSASDPEQVERAAAVVLPGVGAFGAGRAALAAGGFDRAIARRVAAGAPTLAVCLGMQLLLDGSEESPEAKGLGLLPGTARRFPVGIRRPQMGWNTVEPDAGAGLLEPGAAYFANSYRLVEAPPGWRAAWADHGGRFVAALERDAVLLAQFHPELSGAWGGRLLRAWVALARQRAEQCSPRA